MTSAWAEDQAKVSTTRLVAKMPRRRRKMSRVRRIQKATGHRVFMVRSISETPFGASYKFQMQIARTGIRPPERRSENPPHCFGGYNGAPRSNVFPSARAQSQ